MNNTVTAATAIDAYLNLQDLIENVASLALPSDVDYDGFSVDRETRGITIHYVFEPNCECCTYDYGDTEYTYEDFERLVQVYLEESHGKVLS